MENFEHGEKVLVRNYENDEWIERVYVGTMPNCKQHWVMKFGQNKKTFDGLPSPWPWNQVRKIEKPETIDQRMDKLEAIFNADIKDINEQIQSIKKQLK